MGSISPPTAKTLINLQRGWPSPSLFAASELLAGANEVLTSKAETAAALIYGPHIGHPTLRESVAGWLSDVYPTTTVKDRICITSGASVNLANIAMKFLDPLYTRAIFMIEPTYFLACPIFEDCGFQGKLRGVPENEDGLDIEFLRRALDSTEAAAVESVKARGVPDIPILKTGKTYPKVYKFVIYLVPTFSNPSAKTLSLSLRKELVLLAREYDALVISDDVYDFLIWPEDPAANVDDVGVPPRLVDIDRQTAGNTEFGNTLSNGSFSKIIGPGVRVGWAEGTPAFVEQLAEVGSSSSGGGPSHTISTFVDKMLRSNKVQTHIKDVLIPCYRQRYYILIDAIKRSLVPLGVEIEVKSQATAGGFFTYIRLPSDLPSGRMVAAYLLKNMQLRVAFGDMFVVAGDEGSVKRAQTIGGFDRCLRLCWAWHEEDELREGVERLKGAIVAIREILKRGGSLQVDENIGIR